MAQDESYLSLTKGEIITSVSVIDDVWATGHNFEGRTGKFPLYNCQVPVAHLLVSLYYCHTHAVSSVSQSINQWVQMDRPINHQESIFNSNCSHL